MVSKSIVVVSKATEEVKVTLNDHIAEPAKEFALNLEKDREGTLKQFMKR